ncbi:hypothetical protein BDD14_6554 [Edaphobacter modestus]|uniref:Uncharacterized protein n=1 Tax=Edaphobacter modestus TaxID=388466 RepID=A0A4Q7XY01_9BACT|nr:hypothetical protein BDD14_6554 [Edaphobacter modestus]
MEFRGLPGGRASDNATVEASGFGTAINRAFAEIRKRPKFSGRNMGDELVVRAVRYKGKTAGKTVNE